MSESSKIANQSLSDKADERERSTASKIAGKVVNGLVSFGLFVSAVLTVIYLMLLVDEAIGLPDPYGYLFGFLVGIVAIVPAELALFIWRSRLDSDATITTGQRTTAVVAVILAGIFSALTTSSFFSYSLPQLFPESYLVIAPTLNVGAIVGSWIVFLMAIVAYAVFSRQTQQNLSQAKANQSVFDARMEVIRSAGEAIRIEAANLIERMDENNIFAEDARRLIITALGMENERIGHLFDNQTLITSGRYEQSFNGENIIEAETAEMDGIETGEIFKTYRQQPGGKWQLMDQDTDYNNLYGWVFSQSEIAAPRTQYKIMLNDEIVTAFEKHPLGIQVIGQQDLRP